MSFEYRPWGKLSWALEQLKLDDWSFIGCLSPEDRCVASWEYLTKSNLLGNDFFVRIDAPPSEFDEEIDAKIKKHQENNAAIPSMNEELRIASLFATNSDIFSIINDLCNNCNGNLILDITSFPIRFFFPMIKQILKNHKDIRNVIVTYSVADKYSKEQLTFDPKPFGALPTFQIDEFPEPKKEMAIISIGFVPMELPSLTSEFEDTKIRMLFPFPPGPPNYNRNWEFLKDFSNGFSGGKLEDPIRVHAYDASDCFEHLCNETEQGQRLSMLLPYGPKPISLAMCLFAIEAGHPVYYTQPTIYNPNYSTGVEVENGESSVYAYCVKLDGRNLYTL